MLAIAVIYGRFRRAAVNGYYPLGNKPYRKNRKRERDKNTVGNYRGLFAVITHNNHLSGLLYSQSAPVITLSVTKNAPRSEVRFLFYIYTYFFQKIILSAFEFFKQFKVYALFAYLDYFDLYFVADV